MSEQRSEFDIPAALAPQALRCEAGSGLRAEHREERRLRRSWLDTFDARLYRAGLLLEHEEPAGTLCLRPLHQERPRAAATGVALHGEAPALPEGALAEQVSAIAGIRRLLLIGSLELLVQEIQLLDEQHKIRVRCYLERAAAPVATGCCGHWQPPDRLRVSPLRGFAAEASQLAATLEAQGLVPAPAEWLEALARRLPGPGLEYRSRPAPALAAGDSAAEAVAKMLDAGFTVMQQNVPGIVADHDTEFLHDFRTAARRTRTVISDVSAVIEPQTRQHWRERFRELSRRSSELRDLDVLLLALPGMTGDLAPHLEAPLEAFEEALRLERGRAHAALREHLEGPGYADFQAAWPAFTRGILDSAAPGLEPERPAPQMAGEAIGRLYRRTLKRARRVDATASFERLHDLRKMGKRLRYMTEAFGGLCDEAAAALLLGRLKRLQDELGALCDLDVQLRTFAGYEQRCAGRGEHEQAAMLAELQRRLRASGRFSHERLLQRIGKLQSQKARRAIAAITAADRRKRRR